MVDAYLRDCERRGLAKRTIESYSERLATLTRDTLGRPPPGLTRDDVQRWIDARGGPASRATHRSTAVQFWRWMIEEGHTATNTAALCRAPTIRPGRPRPIDRGQLGDALARATPKIRCALALGAYAGLRVAEMAALRWADIDLAGHVIEVAHGKGDRARVVPMHAALEAALIALGPARRGTVLLTRAGAPYQPRILGQRISKHLRACGIDATAHQLRHSFATAVYASTHDIRATAKLLGHSSIQTTEVYARFDLTSDLVAAVRSLAVA